MSVCFILFLTCKIRYLWSSNVRALSLLISRTNRVASEHLLILEIMFRYCCILIAPGISMGLRSRMI